MSIEASVVARLAQADDIDGVSGLLADAFVDYAWTNWAVPAEDHRERLRLLYEIHSAIGVQRGDLWVLEADGAIVSAAAWSLLDGSTATVSAAFRGVSEHLTRRAAAELPPLFGDRLGAVQRAEGATLARRPSGPYWFLDCVGTVPHLQGRGYGRQLIIACLARLDEDRIPTTVETSTEPNVRFYERLGFEQMACLHLGAGAPPVWVMTRPVRHQ